MMLFLDSYRSPVVGQIAFVDLHLGFCVEVEDRFPLILDAGHLLQGDLRVANVWDHCGRFPYAFPT